MDHVGFAMVLYGIFSVVGSTVWGKVHDSLGKRAMAHSLTAIFIISTILVIIGDAYNIMILFYIACALNGAYDSLQTMIIFSTIATIYPNDNISQFSTTRFVMSMSTAVSFFAFKYIPFYPIIGWLIANVVVSVVMFHFILNRLDKNRTTNNSSTPNENQDDHSIELTNNKVGGQQEAVSIQIPNSSKKYQNIGHDDEEYTIFFYLNLWASERYPQIIQNLVDSNPPEYDNLYLDMNGIIHACSQEMTTKLIRFSEEELIRLVCNYIDKLFHIIRPTKLLYMAIDGVAPRSKLNQQRQRRFLSVFREEKEKKELIKEGKELPEVIFSRNAITPGTEFMSNLSECLQFFIKKKISEDLSWREIEIIFSGPENPGEGEHKIIDYIRKYKASPDWDPNQSHCLYGLDADLILLALVTHEPHFSILREEIAFRPQANKQLDFQLLHISLLREYMELELKCELDFGYSLERIIDDFVLVMIFFGNDFLPHLPFCEISTGGLNSVLELYKNSLNELGGYLTDEAEIDLDRLAVFLAKIAVFERKQNLTVGEAEENEVVEDMLLENDVQDDEEKKEIERRAFERLKNHFGEITFEDDDVEDINDYWINGYYRSKFPDFPEENRSAIVDYKRHLVLKYVEGLSWVLNYYHNGCISWRWYYPYYYAPLAVDMRDLSSLEIEFESNGPVTPFQQLMSVLPPQSAHLLPAPYQELMTSAASPIIDFYPTEFEVDTSDSHYFDGIAVIGFPDLGRLLEATAAEDSWDLTDKERSRNALRNAVIIYHDAEQVVSEPSPNLRLFPSLEHSSAKTEDFILPFYEGLKPFRLCEGVLLGSHSPSGFPTFAVDVDFTWEYKNAVVNIWGMKSRKESIIVHPPIPQLNKDKTAKQMTLASIKHWIGRRCYVNWPYNTEALIVGFSDSNQKISMLENVSSTNGTVRLTTQDYLAVQKVSYLDQLKKIPMDYLTKGIDVSEVTSNTILVHVRKIAGIDVEFGGRTVKRYTEKEYQLPIQLMVEYDKVRADSRYLETEEIPFATRFPIGKQVLYTNPDHFGAIGKVLGHADESTETLDLELKVGQSGPDLHFGHRVAKEETDEYFPIQHVCKATGLTNQQLSLLTGGLFIDKPMTDIGLNMKFTGRNQQLMGYCRGTTLGDRNGGTYKKWEFSNDAIQLIMDYLKTFPIIQKILVLVSQPSDDKSSSSGGGIRAIDISSLISEKTDRVALVKSIEEYFDKTGIRRKRYVPCDSLSLSKKSIKRIEDHYGRLAAAAILIPMRTRTQSDKVIEPASYESVISYEKQHVIQKAHEQQLQKERKYGGGSGTSSPGTSSPSKPKQHERQFRLGDRVITMLDKGNVPFGLYGTVVSIQDQKVDVVLDRECFSGNNLEGFCSEKRGLFISKWRLYNLSTPDANYRRATKSEKEGGYRLGSFPEYDSNEYWNNLKMTNDQDHGVVKIKVNHQANTNMVQKVQQQTQNLNWQQQQEVYRQNQRKTYHTRQDQFVKTNWETEEDHATYRKTFPNVQTQQLNWQQLEQQQKSAAKQQQKGEKAGKGGKKGPKEQPQPPQQTSGQTPELLQKIFDSSKIVPSTNGNNTAAGESSSSVQQPSQPQQPQQPPQPLMGLIYNSLESQKDGPADHQATPPPPPYGYPPGQMHHPMAPPPFGFHPMAPPPYGFPPMQPGQMHPMPYHPHQQHQQQQQQQGQQPRQPRQPNPRYQKKDKPQNNNNNNNNNDTNNNNNHQQPKSPHHQKQPKSQSPQQTNTNTNTNNTNVHTLKDVKKSSPHPKKDKVWIAKPKTSPTNSPPSTEASSPVAPSQPASTNNNASTSESNN
ncbi:5'-3' exoribonuclease [Cavenderia fasciculata]|uniref:5'-3' exoribonuclease n=1 Tax=Cavenderia fasciculata TaxID=261658 RepID=F4QE37_CACFS|nr:5'-3' exoribonuclease [Cavenderia fasciculata]EGG13984.1 5'-3' exoribonuclease [Cavenderia fasciculata]|eukprot:XP_004350692.1 5'-3' exoribonuclease [Cavenderia fasciculata]